MEITQRLTTWKRSTYKLSEDKVHEQLVRLSRKAVGKTLAERGWKPVRLKADWEQVGDGYLYAAYTIFRKETVREVREDVADREWQDIRRKFYSGGRALGWLQKKEEAEGAAPETECGPVLSLPASDAELAQHFSHIYDRDAQIRTIWASICSAESSQYKIRNHCLLWGAPACGKSETLLQFGRILGDQRCLKLDATSMTKAGAERLILEMETVPPFILIEEIEKCNPANLPWLLGVMDSRGEILKTNARIGQTQRTVQSVVLATANNMEVMRSIMSGALASRFAHQIYFPRPNRAVLEKILAREIAEKGGSLEWINPAIEYLIEEGSSDPRRAKAILDGRERLVSGEYQNDQRSIREAMERDGAK